MSCLGSTCGSGCSLEHDHQLSISEVTLLTQQALSDSFMHEILCIAVVNGCSVPEVT